MDPVEIDFEALAILVEADCLNKCDGHNEYYESVEPVEEAYKLANTMISKGEIRLSEKETRKDITDRLKSA